MLQFRRTFLLKIFGRNQQQRKPKVRCVGMRRGSRKKGFAMPMDTAQEYRLAACDCLRMAEVTSHPETLDSLLSLAQHWAQMAEQAERSNRYRGVGHDRRAA